MQQDFLQTDSSFAFVYDNFLYFFELSNPQQIFSHTAYTFRWSLIAKRLPGRTDNEIKNYWNTCLSKKLKHEHDLIESEPSIIVRTKATRCTTKFSFCSNNEHIIENNATETTEETILPTMSSDEPSASSDQTREENWWDLLGSLDTTFDFGNWVPI